MLQMGNHTWVNEQGWRQNEHIDHRTTVGDFGLLAVLKETRQRDSEDDGLEAYECPQRIS